MSEHNIFHVHSFEGKDYTLPYWLPERKAGPCSIEIEFKPAGSKLPLVSMRNSIFMGLKPAMVRCTQPLGIHFLKDKGHGTWMTSMPQEVEQHYRQLVGMSGRVLVGGLGLGLAVAVMESEDWDCVEEILVVEKSYSIIQMVMPFLPKKKTKVFRGDLFTFLNETKETFDAAFYDIWQLTGENAFKSYVYPLRKLSRGVVPNEEIQCWNEEEMRGQIEMACQSGLLALQSEAGSYFRAVLDCPEDQFERIKEARGFPWYFYRWLRQQRPSMEQAKARIPEFMEDLRDPDKFDKQWTV